MSKIPQRNSEKILRLFFQKGFEVKRKKGSHVILGKDKRLVVVPVHKGRDIPKGTLHNIMKQAGLSKTDLYGQKSN